MMFDLNVGKRNGLSNVHRINQGVARINLIKHSSQSRIMAFAPIKVNAQSYSGNSNYGANHNAFYLGVYVMRELVFLLVGALLLYTLLCLHKMFHCKKLQKYAFGDDIYEREQGFARCDERPKGSAFGNRKGGGP